MPRAPLYTRWLAALFAAKLSPAARDTMAAYAAHMTPDGIIRIDQSTISEWTGRDRRHITRHISQARRQGLLDIVERSGPGRPATYRATMPPPAS